MVLVMRKVLLGIALFSTFYCSGQKSIQPPEHRIITLTPADKSIQASIEYRKKSGNQNDKRYYYWYDGTTIQSTQSGFNGHLLDGEYSESQYPQNNILCKGTFKNGLKNGEWLSWHPNGKIKSIENWKYGLLHGEQYTYDEKGICRTGVYYDHGHRCKPEDDTLTHRQQKLMASVQSLINKIKPKKDTTASKK